MSTKQKTGINNRCFPGIGRAFRTCSSTVVQRVELLVI